MSKHMEFKLMQKEAQKVAASVPHKILVMSGKGGVGKTTVAVNLAFALAEEGYHVGILDADLHGPNAALMAGVEGIPAAAEDGKLVPVFATSKVSVLSISAFMKDRDTPIIWRGPRKAGAIQQFLGEGDWSHADVLVVDCPPGTGDEPLSVAQLIPDADGVVIVTTPQDVALLDSRKSINFVKQLNMPVLGVVENMAGFVCPHCGETVDLFKVGGGEKAAGEMSVAFLGRVPLTQAVVEAGDSGKPVVIAHPEDKAAEALMAVATKLASGWKGPKDVTSEKKTEQKDVGAETSSETAAQKAEANDPETKNASSNEIQYVAVATDGTSGLDAKVSGHFGRCTHYTLVETQGGKIVGHKVVENPFAASHEPGQVPAFVKELGAHVIISGGMGPRAVELFKQYGIQIGTGATGSVRAAVEQYWSRNLNPDGGCEESEHHHH